MSDHIIDVNGFKMSFGSKAVINDLSFTVRRGEVFGFLGSNGSGKTTTIRALLDVYQPTAGSLRVNGTRFSAKMVHMLGYLPEERGLYVKEKVIDNMMYFGQLKGLTRNEARLKSIAYLDRVGLADKAQSKLNKLSGGQQQKIQLGVTIINDPELLILDEPTKGLDPVNRSLLMNIVEEHHSKGSTILMVTHQMDEVERLCDRVLLLKDGARRLYGEVDEVRDNFGDPIIAVRFEGTLPQNESLYSVIKKVPRYAELQPTSKSSADKILRYLIQQNLAITLFEKRSRSLEDIFVQIYGEDIEVHNA